MKRRSKMLTNPYTHKRPLERDFTIKGRVGDLAVMTTVTAMNAMDAADKIKKMYPGIDIQVIHLVKSGAT
jgi:hypothetical protein